MEVLSPNTETVTNEQGGKQSHVPHSPTCLPPRVLLDQSLILAKGKKKYGKDNWKQIPPDDHLDHALVHIFGYMVGDIQDNHLGHAICRLMMAHELLLEVNSVKGETE